MTHKQNCVRHCMQYLNNLQLSDIYSQSVFEHIYRKKKGSEGNAFTVGLHAADMMINQAQKREVMS